MAQERKNPTRVGKQMDEDEQILEQRKRAKEKDRVSEEIGALLDGSKTTEDPVMLYLIDGVKDTLAERTAVAKNLQQAEQAVVQFRSRMVELKGVHSKMIEDLTKRIAKDPKKKLEPVPDIEEKEPAEPDPEPAV